MTVRRSVDGGATWSVVPTTPTQPAYELVADPTTPGGVYGVRSGRPARSVDGGLTWTLGGTNAGQCSGLGGLAVDPTTPGRVFAADGTAICRSTDYGATWQRTAADRRRGRRRTSVLMTADGVHAGVHRRAGPDLALDGRRDDLDRRERARRARASTAWRRRPDACTSPPTSACSSPTDGGATLPGGLVRPADGTGDRPKVFQYGTNTVYSLEGPSVLRSTDGGATWERRSYGVGVGQLYGVDRDGVLYADISAGGELARSARRRHDVRTAGPAAGASPSRRS